jgi:hypothetical protein
MPHGASIVTDNGTIVCCRKILVANEPADSLCDKLTEAIKLNVRDVLARGASKDRISHATTTGIGHVFVSCLGIKD